MDAEHDGRGVEEGLGVSECRLWIFPEPPIAADLGEEPCNEAAAWVHREYYPIGRLFDDLDSDRGGQGWSLPSIAAVSKRCGDEWEARRDRRRTIQAPPRSSTSIGCGSRTKPRPVVSTTTWCLRPLTLLYRILERTTRRSLKAPEM
jgi:hypothetical protein